jgi:hypothetical protein
LGQYAATGASRLALSFNFPENAYVVTFFATFKWLVKVDPCPKIVLFIVLKEQLILHRYLFTVGLFLIPPTPNKLPYFK